jgi:hypothetical protein
MTFEMQEILRSKRSLRERLTSLPIGEKLRMLDVLRGRSVEIAAVRARLRAERAAILEDVVKRPSS